MCNAFFVSIQRSIEPPFRRGMDHLYSQTGANLGNLLFTNAVWRQVAWTCAEQGFAFDTEYVDENFDIVIIPAANWLYPGFDLEFLADRIERLTIPTVMIGIGAQAEDSRDIPKVSKSALRVVQLVAERSALIGARGEFTADVLAHYGVHNVQVTGCPSFFLNVEEQRGVRKRSHLERVILAGTRYLHGPGILSEGDRLQQKIYRLGFERRMDFLYTSERPELDFLLNRREISVDDPTLADIAEYYAAENSEEFLMFLNQHGRCFLDIDQWLASMHEYDLYIGSRVHGAIAALLAGTPALLFTHDSRTTELASLAKIPSLPVAMVDAISDGNLEPLSTWYDEADWDGYSERMNDLRDNYISFLNANGVPHRVCGSPQDNRVVV